MKKINWKKTIPSFASIIAMLVMVFSTAALASLSVQFTAADFRQWDTGARILDTQSAEVRYNKLNSYVTSDLGCAIVNNPTRGEAIFVPTRTNNEWVDFGGNPPVGASTSSCPINGACGTANGINILNNPSSATQRCEFGIYSSIDSVGNDLTYNWNCNGQFGGTNASCSANRIINGACGSDNGGSFYNTPTNLCNAGTPSAVSGGGGSNFSWTCNGANTGSTASCSATYQSDGPWTLGPWGPCSTSCGTGTQTRTVTCNFDTCTGESNTTRSCTAGSNTCGWTSWGPYGPCSTSCGNGSRYSTRTCTTGAPGSAHCAGSATRATSCSAGSSTCGWGSWGGWGSCSKSCGGGVQYRYRSCNVSGYCSGSNRESRSCNTHACWTCTNPNGNTGDTREQYGGTHDTTTCCLQWAGGSEVTSNRWCSEPGVSIHTLTCQSNGSWVQTSMRCE